MDSDMAGSRLRKIRVAVVAAAAALAGLMVPLAAGSATAATLTVGTPAQADLAVAESVSSASPDYGTGITFNTTVTNTSATTPSAGVIVAVATPAGLLSPTVTPSTGSYASGTWTIGALAPGANVTLTITGLAGDVADGTQTATAVVTATTADPNLVNNTASASEASQPAPVGLSIIPDPGNPPFIGVSSSGTVTWTASVDNAANPAVPPPSGTLTWSCATASTNPCPDAAALTTPNSPSITFKDSSFGVDIYTLTLLFTWTDPNYQLMDGIGAAQTSVTFITTNSGG
jgi:hypothetical protein